jgi:acyl carrier protein
MTENAAPHATAAAAGASATKDRLAALVERASDGAVAAAEARAGGAGLSALGFTSLARMRLIDAVESEYGVEIDLAAGGFALVDDLDALTAHLTAR